MPGMDGTGPLGQGPMTGKGFGPCGGGAGGRGPIGMGYGRGRGKGRGRKMAGRTGTGRRLARRRGRFW